MIDYLVLETNELTPITLNSIAIHDPKANVKVVTPTNSLVGTALAHSSNQTVVLKSGVVWRGNSNSIPTKTKEFPICVSEYGVFSNHDKLDHTYGLVGLDITLGNKDLSIFIINPKLWIATPETDIGLMSKVRKLNMPRYMNHKDDLLFKEAIPPHDALYYGVLGLNAVALNYVSTILQGEVTANETFAYLFDEVAKYTNGLDNSYKDLINDLGVKTKKRIGKLRLGLSKINNLNERTL